MHSRSQEPTLDWPCCIITYSCLPAVVKFLNFFNMHTKLRLEQNSSLLPPRVDPPSHRHGTPSGEHSITSLDPMFLMKWCRSLAISWHWWWGQSTRMSILTYTKYEWTAIGRPSKDRRSGQSSSNVCFTMRAYSNTRPRLLLVQVPPIYVPQLGTSSTEEEQDIQVRGKTERKLQNLLPGRYEERIVCKSGSQRNQ